MQLSGGCVLSVVDEDVARIGSRADGPGTRDDGPNRLRPPGCPRLDICFVSSNFTWGGSEDLWSETAARLAEAGHRVTVYKNRLNRGEGNVDRLRALRCRLVELARFPLLPKKLFSLVGLVAHRLSVASQTLRLYSDLRFRKRPHLVVVSQGGNYDGWPIADVCRRLKLPYVLISQKASDLYWPDDRWRPRVRRVYENALHGFFVSEHNRRLTEEQVGAVLPRASVVRNPFKVPWNDPPEWPADDGVVRLACVGRFYIKEKGQDLLMRVLAGAKWRARPIEVTLYGSGEHDEALREMAAYLDLSNLRFGGFVSDIRAIWAEHHALLLPSRAEGLPLVVVEAMLSGRVPIVTNVAGNPEVVHDNVTGFLAAAATEAAVDEALERAWHARHRWPEIGRAAAASIRGLVPPDPAGTLAGQLLDIATGRLPLTIALGAALPEAAE